jgi:Rad3-related DNA helicase
MEGINSHSKITKTDYERFFPFAEIREPQETAIDFILNSFKTNRFVILEAGTGVGKSAIGVTVSRYLKSNKSFLYRPNDLENEGEQTSSYFLTPQKILQKQYIEDFGCVKMSRNKKKKKKQIRESEQGEDSCSDGGGKCQGDIGDIGDIEDLIGAQDVYHMNSISSSTNFKCKEDFNMSCADRNRLAKIKGDSDENFRKCGRHCVYRQSKDRFKENTDGVTNTQYFLSETTYVGELKKRRLLVIDEAHNCDSELSNFINITITEKLVNDLGLDFPPKETMNEDTTKPWIEHELRPVIMKEIEELTKETKDLCSRRFTKKMKQDLMDKLKRLKFLETLYMQINKFTQHYKKDDWILDIALKIEFIDGHNQEIIDKITYKPIIVAGMAEDYLFKWGEKILFMSATILSKNIFCELIGLNPDTTAMISIPSPFPIKNMPMYYAPAGSMSYSTINETLPKAAKLIQRILKKHKSEKGIIHSHSYKTTEYIKENTGAYSDRILTHTSKNRDAILRRHKKSSKPTVLMSPSMQEGIDLKGNCSRFQVICKIPYPYLGDKWVKARMKRWTWWYNYETAKTIIQSIGRSIRNETDYATTYIIDSAWSGFFGRTKHLYPPNFEKRFEIKSPKKKTSKNK